MEDKISETPSMGKEGENSTLGQKSGAKAFLLPDKAYNVLKWLALIALPALAWFIGILGPTWGIPHVDAIVTTINVVGTLIGILIGASTLKGSITLAA